MLVKNKKVLVYGMSQSGIWVTKLLKKKHAKVYIYDDNRDQVRKNYRDCYLVENLTEDLISSMDMLVVSPSIELDNPNLNLAREHKVPIISEIELASSYVKKYVAITGTNGKTTTVELVAKILSKQHMAVACGNNGYPVSRALLERKRSIFVMEVSSFMLEHADSFAPHVATVLNIEPDHLIRHKTFESYKDLKLSIFKNIKPRDYAVINIDSNIIPKLEAMTVTYSCRRQADVYLKNGYIYLHQHRIIAIKELKLKGRHNVLNVMCAICYADIYKVKPAKIRQAIIEYSPEPYRNERVAVKNGIEFINDSKSTNVASTLASVESVKNPIVLLLGGSDKGLDYKPLFESLPKMVKKIVAFGRIASTLAAANEERFELVKAVDLPSAFTLATQDLKKHDTVLLSPATASYDQFNNYVERGKCFNQLVSEYGEKKD